MAEYTNTQPDVVLQSTWRCSPTTTSSGSVVYKITSQPTEASVTIVFPISVPAGSQVVRAWFTVEKPPQSPLSGARYRRINGVDIPSDNTVEIPVDDVAGAQYEAVLTFKANGSVFQDTNQHTGAWRVVEPTIHVEYTDGETTEPEDPSIPSSPPEENTETSDNDPSDGRFLLPRLLDENMAEKARLRPSNLSLELNLVPLSTAQMRLPEGEADVMVRDLMELFAPSGSVGIYRVSEVSTVRGVGGGSVVHLEHAFSTLSDSLAIGVQGMTGTVAQVVATLLEAQNKPYWVLGDCDVPEDYEMIYEYTDDNLLKAIMGVVNLLPEGYLPEFNTRVFPFVLHIRKTEDTAFCEARLSRNMASVRQHIDSRELCNRVIPYGAGEGTDRIELTGLIGQDYLDADTIDTWGVVARTFVNEDIYDAITLKEVAQRYLDKHKNPTHSIEIDGFDLYAATGEELDRFRMGRMCRVPMPGYGTFLNDRVISKAYPDVYNKPDKVTVTLANKMRNVGDEIASLFRDVTQSKLLGGSIKTEEKTLSAGEIYVDDPFAMYFDVKEYGNLIAVRLYYTCRNVDTSEMVSCRITMDGTQLPAEEDKGGVVDLLQYMKKDTNGVPMLGQHVIGLSPKASMDDEHFVQARLVIKTVERK